VTALLERRLVACVNALPGATSRYRWQGTIVRDEETVLILKTEAARVPELIDAVNELHPYDVPELLSLPVEAGNPSYLDWARHETAH
jgi:periplasmic divalent cation tolerance protein